jgi:hypothetical protein
MTGCEKGFFSYRLFHYFTSPFRVHAHGAYMFPLERWYLPEQSFDAGGGGWSLFALMAFVIPATLLPTLSLAV